jgi:TRAP-type C4-dicarboxylate transport system substrate-binding protein
MKARRRAPIVLAMTITIALAACGGSAAPLVDRGGNEAVTLDFATIDGPDFNDLPGSPETFASHLADVSGDRLKAKVTYGYDGGGAEAETAIVEAIKAGDLDGGWPSARAFAGAGITGLKAVEAPLLLSNYDAEKALVSGPGADLALAALEDSGILGLELSVGQLRRPISAGHPLLAPPDWADVRFRSFNSPVQKATIEELGGVPKNVGSNWSDLIAAGDLDGAEFDIPALAASGFTSAPNVSSNIVLWPKVYVLSVSQERFDALSSEQQGWIREAARRTMQASLDTEYNESSMAQELCGDGLRFVTATDEQIAALREKVQPVIDSLAEDETNSQLLAEVQKIAVAHPAPAAVSVPPDCRVAVADDSEHAGIPETTAPIPEGKYRVAITPGELEAAGYSNAQGWTGTWTLEVSDGTFALYCQSLELPGKDCGNATSDRPFEAGFLRGDDATVWFVSSPELLSELSGCTLPPSSNEGHCPPLGSFWMDWKFDGKLLTFSAPPGEAPVDRILKPLEQIGD